ncbi:hypothetical protein JCM21900_005176 [Sporobolomyces salmonicolor]
MNGPSMASGSEGAEQGALKDAAAPDPPLDPPASADDQDGEKKGPKQACMACRSIKMRCVPLANEARCARCNRLDKECVWTTPQKRGRKPRTVTLPPGYEPPAGASLNSKSSPATSQAPTLTAHSRSNSEAFPPPPLSLQPTASASNSTAQPQLPAVSAFGSASESPIFDSPSAHSEPGGSVSLSLVEVARAKEAALAGLRGGSSSTPTAQAPHGESVARREPDPIDLRLLSEFEAKQLIDHFHSTLNSFIILLDRHLHTLDFVRRTSTVLLTSMLAVSSKFFRPDLYPSLLMQAKQLTGRAIVEGVASLGLIQSILLLVYWKEPLDATSWFRIGMAIRLGLQLHLHAERTTPLPADAHEARLILDRERTWICLVCFDHYFLQVHDADDGFHQTFMIPQYRIRIEKWLEETAPYDTPDDLEQGAALEWVKVLRLAKDIARARPAHARALASHLNAMLEATYQLYLETSSPLNGKLNRQATVKVRYFLDAASVALNRSLLVAVGTNGVSLANFMVSASQLVDSVEALAREGMMRYVQDNLAVTMFGFAEFLAKLFPRAYPANQATIISYVERVYRACELAAEGKEDSTPAFVSRFYQTTLRVICTGPAPGLAPPIFPPVISSRAALPNPGARAGSSSGFPSLSPAPHPAASTAHFDSGFSFSDGIGGDSAYWDSLFPGHQGADWSWLDQGLNETMYGGGAS